jgi:D-3-phosphoglycerate dehydrogenase
MDSVRVLVADKLEAVGIAGLDQLGCELSVQASVGADGLAAAVRGFGPHVLIVRSTKVKADAIAAGAPGLRGIVRAGAGVDNIDAAAARAHGVAVCNCPGMNAVAVAELTIGHLIALDRRLPEQDAAARSGTWDKAEFARARGLKGAALLVIGTGAIGTEVITRAKAFGMRVFAQSRSLRDDTARALGITPVAFTRAALLAALPEMDGVSIHVASTPETRNLCDAAFFEAMKPGAMFVNTARGDLVDEGALARAVEGKGVRAGLDVHADQPAGKSEPWHPRLADVKGVVHFTHHCGASTDQAQLAVAEETVRIVRAFRDRGEWINAVGGGV